MVYGLGSIGMKPQVLILEDNYLLAENLADLVKADLGGEALITPSVDNPATNSIQPNGGSILINVGDFGIRYYLAAML